MIELEAIINLMVSSFFLPEPKITEVIDKYVGQSSESRRCF